MIDQQASPRVRRRLVVAAAMGSVLLGLLLLGVLFAGRGDGERAALTVPPRPARATVPAPAAPPAPADDVAALLAARGDPFRQIVTVPKEPEADAVALGSPAPTPPAATPPAATPPAPTPPAVNPPAVTPTAAASPAAPPVVPGTTDRPAGPVVSAAAPFPRATLPVADQNGQTPTGGGQPATRDVLVELRSIFKDEAGVERAHIVVEGISYTPVEREVFSVGLQVEINGSCVDVSAGSARVPLCLVPPVT